MKFHDTIQIYLRIVSSGMQLVPLNAVADKELCFPTVQWALDHCLNQKDAQVTRIQQMTKYHDKEKEVWSEFEDETPLLCVCLVRRNVVHNYVHRWKRYIL